MNSIFQTPEWEEFKLKTGYEKSYRVDDVLVLQKQLPFGRTMLYSPMVDQNIEYRIQNKAFLEEVKKIARENNSIFYRLEIDAPESSQLLNSLTSNSFIKSFEEMQPEHTLVLDLTQTEEEILEQMKPKGRYNIKVAEKHGIVIQKTDSVDAFYSLYEKMARRQKITHRSRKYFENLVDSLGKKGYCEVFVATLSGRHCEKRSDEAIFHDRLPRLDGLAMTKQDDVVLASAIITFYGDTAIYLFGGSSDEMRNTMAPYALHWEIIKEAKQRGFKRYDFFGIAPVPEQSSVQGKPRTRFSVQGKPHPWAGVTRFKKQFGGQEIKLLGSWDLVFRPTEYKAFKIAERLRRH